jgi:hypothetical protein
MLSSPAAAEEKEPLLPKDGGVGEHKTFWASPSAMLNRFTARVGTVVDTMTYDASVMTTWQVFTIRSLCTPWTKKSTWTMMGLLFMVSSAVALMMSVVVIKSSKPEEIKSSKFFEIGLFLRVFVGLLLGFFLTSSTNRWYQCVNGFMSLFDAVRNMQMQFLALGVPAELRFQCIRYGFVSGLLLDKTLHMRKVFDEEKEIYAARMWKELVDESCSTNAELYHKTLRSKVTPAEAELLMKSTDPAGMMWYWVASLVGRMAQDGVIPPMASPTYGRIMNLAQAAHAGIRLVNWSVVVQAPFCYVHMLATLVHVNNFINAISFGITLGTYLGTLSLYHNWVSSGSAHIEAKSLISDLENLVVMLFIGMVGPLIYQCLLDVSIGIAQPFASSSAHIPTDKLLHSLATDLLEAEESLHAPPGWEPPCFKPPAAAQK